MRRPDNDQGWCPASPWCMALAGCTPEIEPPRDAPTEPGAPRQHPLGGRRSVRRRRPRAGPAGAVTLAFAGDVHFEGGVGGAPRPTATRPRARWPTRSCAAPTWPWSTSRAPSPPAGRRRAKELEDPTHRYWFRSPPSALAFLDRSGVDVVVDGQQPRRRLRRRRAARQPARPRGTRKVDVIGIGDGRDAGVPPLPDHRRRRPRSPCSPRTPRRWRARRRSGTSVGGPGLARPRRRPAAGRRPEARRRPTTSSRCTCTGAAENVGCPTAGQLELAADLAAAGADVVVGAHAHVPLGAGMLGDTYVSYGLGNFLWYHGNQPDTGVLRLQIARRRGRRRRVGARDDPADGGPPHAADRARAGRGPSRSGRTCRGCTNLAPVPSPPRLDPRRRGRGCPRTPSSIDRCRRPLRGRMTEQQPHLVPVPGRARRPAAAAR